MGPQLVSALQRDATGNDAVTILKACFGVKSPSTLLKRASAFCKYIAWFDKTAMSESLNLRPLPSEEDVVWQHFLWLQTNIDRVSNQPSQQLRVSNYKPTESATTNNRVSNQESATKAAESATDRVSNQERPSQQPRTTESATKNVRVSNQERTESATKKGPFQQPKIKAKGGGMGGV